MVMDSKEVADRIEIQAALAKYAAGIDGHDWELWKSVFTPDADVDYTRSGPTRGTPDAVSKILAAAFGNIPWAMHYITNTHITFDGANHAKVTAMFYNPCQLPDMDKPSVFGGYYYHDFVRTPVGWKSEHAVEELLWMNNPPPALQELHWRLLPTQSADSEPVSSGDPGAS
jgi:hypothetical protein